MARFLKQEEYGKTRALNELCFPGEEFAREYYDEGGILENRVIVKELDGKVVAQAHLAPRKAWYRRPDGTPYFQQVDYILCVATDPAYRHRGFMDEVMELAIRKLQEEGQPWTFLIAVNKEIYRHLGFVYDWTFNPEEEDLLYADEGLTECSARLLCAEQFVKPERITE